MSKIENDVTRRVLGAAQRAGQEAGLHVSLEAAANEAERRRQLGLEPPEQLPLIEVWSTVELYGFHNWPAAATVNPNRAYLAYRHRHKFIVTAYVRVHGGDRDVEFHDLHDQIVKWWDDPERGVQSCEVMAMLLRHYLTAVGQRVTRITVSEDGYDGATVTWKQPD